MAFLVVFFGRLIVAPARLYWEQRKKAEKLDDNLRAAKAESEGADLGPNWPIHELFFHVEPEVLDRPDDTLWEKTGDELRDALSLGKLHIWGRPAALGAGSDTGGERAALRLIDKPYWHTAYFTYMFFYESTSDAPHCFADRNTGRPAYTDLQINRGEALRLWPGDPPDLAESYPNVRLADSPEVLALFNGAERAKLIALLTASRLSSWARVMAATSRDFVLLNGGVWNNAEMKFIAKSPNHSGNINQTYLKQKSALNDAFYDICLNYAQLIRAWPRLSIRRSKCDRG